MLLWTLSSHLGRISGVKASDRPMRSRVFESRKPEPWTGISVRGQSHLSTAGIRRAKSMARGSGARQRAVNLACDVALEHTDGFTLGASVFDPALHVSPGSWIGGNDGGRSAANRPATHPSGTGRAAVHLCMKPECRSRACGHHGVSVVIWSQTDCSQAPKLPRFNLAAVGPQWEPHNIIGIRRHPRPSSGVARSMSKDFSYPKVIVPVRLPVPIGWRQSSRR